MAKRPDREEQLLIAAFLTLLVFPLLYLFRALDDNTLTNWSWLFGSGDMLRSFGFIACGIGVSFVLARTGAVEQRPALFLVSLSLAAVVPLWNEPEAILDASRYFLQAKHFELYGMSSFLREWGAGISAWTDLPAVPFCYGLIFRFFGETRLSVQIFTTLLFSLSALMTFLIGRKLWNAETGLYGGLLLLGSPYLLIQVPLMLVDVPTLFFLSLALYAFLNALDRGGAARIAFSALCLVLALFSKYSAGLMLLVLIPIVLVRSREKGKAIAVRSLAVAAAAGLASGAIALIYADVIRHQLGIFRSYQIPGLSRWSESLVSTFCFQVHPFITVLALAGVVAAIRKRDVRFLIPAWFAVFGLAVERIRYILPLFPLLSLAAACGLFVIREKEVRMFVALSVVATAVALAQTAYLPFLDRTSMANLKEAAEYLDSLPYDRIEVRVVPQQESAGNTETAIPILDLYTRKQIVYRRKEPPAFDWTRIERSPLRFTWECPLPAYYFTDNGGRDNVIALISGSAAPPSGTIASFANDTKTFKYRTIVTVYREQRLAERAQDHREAVLFGTAQ